MQKTFNGFLMFLMFVLSCGISFASPRPMVGEHAQVFVDGSRHQSTRLLACKGSVILERVPGSFYEYDGSTKLVLAFRDVKNCSQLILPTPDEYATVPVSLKYNEVERTYSGTVDLRDGIFILQDSKGKSFDKIQITNSEVE